MVRKLATLLGILLILNLVPSSAIAADQLLYSNDNSTYGGWNQGQNELFIYKMTAVAGVTITTAKAAFASGVTTGAPITKFYFFSDNSGNVGSVLSTFNYASNDGSRWGTYTGTFTVPAGGTFWVAMQATAFIYNAGNSATNSVSNGWSLNISNRFYATSTTGAFTAQSTASSPVWQFLGASTTPLATPSAPTVTTTSTTLGVSESSTTPNASSYLVKVFASNGTTLVDSRTVSSVNITSQTTFSGLSPNTNYKVGVIAVGDGVTYDNSALSTLTSVTTSMGISTLSLTITGNPSVIYFRNQYQLRATVTGSNGYVAFTANGKVISGCKKVTTSALVANCYWKPSIHGQVTLKAILTPSDSNYNSSLNSNSIFSVARSTNR